MAWAPSDNKAARLVGYWLTGSYNAAFVLGLSLVSGNVGGQTKKGASLLFSISITVKTFSDTETSNRQRLNLPRRLRRQHRRSLPLQDIRGTKVHYGDYWDARRKLHRGSCDPCFTIPLPVEQQDGQRWEGQS